MKQLVESFRIYGFAETTLSSEITFRLRNLARTFYEKPLAERIKLAAFRGSSVLGFYPSEDEARCISEQFGYSIPVFESQKARGYSSFDFIANEAILAATPLFGSTCWPPDTAFKSEAYALYEILSQLMKGVGEAILAYFAEIGLAGQFPLNSFDRPCCSMMRLLRYERSPTEKESKAHTDYEFVTLVLSDSEGLEVRNADGRWIAAPFRPGTAILLPGDMMEVATNGWLQSSLHRVRFGSHDRLSVIFFQGFGLDQKITYSTDQGVLSSTFGKHLCGMLVRGAPHLQSQLQSWEQKLGTTIPEKNPFRARKE